MSMIVTNKGRESMGLPPLQDGERSDFDMRGADADVLETLADCADEAEALGRDKMAADLRRVRDTLQRRGAESGATLMGVPLAVCPSLPAKMVIMSTPAGMASAFSGLRPEPHQAFAFHIRDPDTDA